MWKFHEIWSSNFAHLWTSVTTRPKKLAHFSGISPDILDRFSESFLPYKSTLKAHDGSVPYFLICQGLLPWQPNSVAKTLSTPTDTSYIHCTDTRKRIAISWSNWAQQKRKWCPMSHENFVKFGRVTSELTVLICERHVRHSQKLAFFIEYLLIYWTDFRNLFTVWKSFTYRWWICTLFSNLSMDVAMATK